jgi:hypothetical protein
MRNPLDGRLLLAGSKSGNWEMHGAPQSIGRFLGEFCPVYPAQSARKAAAQEHR